MLTFILRPEGIRVVVESGRWGLRRPKARGQSVRYERWILSVVNSPHIHLSAKTDDRPRTGEWKERPVFCLGSPCVDMGITTSCFLFLRLRYIL